MLTPWARKELKTRVQDLKDNWLAYLILVTLIVGVVLLMQALIGSAN